MAKKITFDSPVSAWFKTIDRHDRGQELVKGDLGIEIECEGRLDALDRAGFFWVQHDEASIRGGTEFVLNRPVPIDLLSNAMQELRERTAKCKFNADSPRTSVHIHKNVQRYTIRELYSVLLAYWAFENALVRMNGTLREGNLFCCRAVDAEAYCRRLIDILGDGEFLPVDWDGQQRYAALNLSSLCKFGSIEFRFIRGLTDWNLVELWARTLNEFCEIARKWSWDDILKHFHYERGATNPQTFERFFPNREFLALAATSVTQEFVVQSMSENLDQMFGLYRALKRAEKGYNKFPDEDESEDEAETRNMNYYDEAGTVLAPQPAHRRARNQPGQPVPNDVHPADWAQQAMNLMRAGDAVQVHDEIQVDPDLDTELFDEPDEA